MVGDTDVADHPFFLGLQRRLVQAGAVAGLGAERRVVELVQVHIVRPQVGQGGVQVFPEVFRILCRRLGGNVHLAADAVERLAQLDLAVGVGRRFSKTKKAAFQPLFWRS